jgi:hypothetical protein
MELITLVLRLVLFIAEMTRDRKQESTGYALAVKEALEQAHRDLALADAERTAAANEHAADPTDSAFDQEFKR